MRLRKISLVIHVDAFGLLLLQKTCRLCVVCEMLIAHDTEVKRVVDRLAPHSAAQPEYLILGTIGSATWREGLSGCITIEEIKNDMADFKAYMRVEGTPQHWSRKGNAAD